MIYTAKQSYKDKQVASDYESQRFGSVHGRIVDRLEKKHIIRGITILTGPPAGQLVVDAPAGTGRLTKKLLQYGFRVIAVDISVEMMREGERIYNLRKLPGFIGYVCAELEHLPFRENSVDVIASLRIMGHLPQQVKAHVLGEFYRITRTGCVVMFALDNFLLKIKRRIQYLTKIKPKPTMWFPLSHSQIIALLLGQRWRMVIFRDLVRWISESRLYVFRK